MKPTPKLLLAGQNRTHLLANLWILSQSADQTELTVLLPRDEAGYTPTLGQELRQTYQYYALLQGNYQASQSLQLPVKVLEFASADLSALQIDFSEYEALVITPLQVSLGTDQEAQCEFSLVQETILDQLGGLDLDSHILEQALSAPAPAAWNLALAQDLQFQCVTQWLESTESDLSSHWQGPAGSLYRCLQDMQLWRHGAMQWHRELLNQVIQKLLASPLEWPLHLILLLYKRFFPIPPSLLATAPDFFQRAYADYREVNQAHIEILPAVQNWEVTILVITYNRQHWLERTLKSIFAQTYPHWRLVLIDHGSTDGTRQYCEHWAANESRITFHHLPDNQGMSGLQHIWQKFCQETETELIAIVADDDWYLPTYLERTVGLMQQFPWLASVYGSYRWVDPNEVPGFQYGPLYPADAIVDANLELQRAMLEGIFPQHHLLRKQVLKRMVSADPYVPEGAEYAAFDYIIGVKLPALFEVGCTQELVSCITLHGQSAYVNDANMIYYLLVVLQEVVRDYTALYGPASYPLSSASQFLQLQIVRNLEKFGESVLNTAEEGQIAALILTHRRTWEQYLHVKTQILPLCAAEIPQIFAHGPSQAYQYKQRD